MAERALKIHPPEIPFAFLRLDAHKVGHRFRRVMPVGRRTMVHQLAGDELVGGYGFLLVRWRLRIGRLSGTSRQGADQPLPLELGWRIALDLKPHETRRKPRFLLEKIRAADLDDTGRAFLTRDRH